MFYKSIGPLTSTETFVSHKYLLVSQAFHVKGVFAEPPAGTERAGHVGRQLNPDTRRGCGYWWVGYTRWRRGGWYCLELQYTVVQRATSLYELLCGYPVVNLPLWAKLLYSTERVSIVRLVVGFYYVFSVRLAEPGGCLRRLLSEGLLKNRHGYIFQTVSLHSKFL